MGPGLFKSYVTQDSVMDVKEGSGETYIFDFGYNVLTLRFLKATDQLDQSTLTTSLIGLAKSR